MKYFLLLCLFVLMMGEICQAQNNGQNVPQTILSKYINSYSGAQDVNWVVEGDSYIAMFKLNGKSHYVRYDKGGEEVELQTEADRTVLPSKALRTIASKYRDWKFHSVYVYSRKNPSEYQDAFLKKMPSHYEVSLFKEHESLMLYFSPKGKLLNKPEKKEIRQM